MHALAWIRDSLWRGCDTLGQFQDNRASALRRGTERDDKWHGHNDLYKAY